MVRGGILILISVGLFWPLAAWVLDTRSVSPEAIAAESQEIIPRFRQYCLPEPGERTVFLLAAALLPAAVCGLDGLACRLELRIGIAGPASRTVRVLRWLAGLISAAGLVIFCRWAAGGEEDYHLAGNWFFKKPLWSVPLLACTLVAIVYSFDRWRPIRFGLHLVVAAVIGLVAVSHVFDATYRHAPHVHFSAVFGPMVRVWLGDVLLVDSSSQYGLYPHFLEPLFALTGLNVPKFTAVMGLLTAAGLACLWIFLCRATRRRFVAAIAFLAMVACSWAFLFWRSGSDLYFQYFPIRFLFPAVLVLLAALYFDRPTRRLYWGTTAFVACGVLWNLDTGLPTLITWIAALAFSDWLNGGWHAGLLAAVRHAAAEAAALAAVLGTYTAGAFAASGQWPDFLRMIAFQDLFYRAGFCMLPMPWPGAWMVVVLVYLSGLAYAMRGVDPVRAKQVFLLAVLGVGLFPYYQGRSHEVALFLVAWPAFLILSLFLDELLDRIRAGERCPLVFTGAGLMIWGLAGPAWGLVINDQVTLRASIAERWSPDRSAAKFTAADAALVERHVPSGAPFYAIADHESLLELALERRSFVPLPYLQTLLVRDAERTSHRLRETPAVTVYLENSLGLPGRSPPLIREVLAENFEVVALTSNGRVLQRQQKRLLSSAADDELSRYSIRVPPGPNKIDLPVIGQPAPYSVEMILKPRSEEQPLATIVSNHPGLSGAAFAGFTLHHVPGSRCDYSLMVGNGNGFTNAHQFELEPDRWSYVAFVFEPDRVTVYHNGERLASSPLPAGAPKPSELPLTLGNWIGRDRTFAGEIRETCVVGRALGAEEISQTAERIFDELGR